MPPIQPHPHRRLPHGGRRRPRCATSRSPHLRGACFPPPAAREPAPRRDRRLHRRTMYGINTGFGKLANVRIAPDRLEQLQANLIRSHAAGVGAPLAAEVVRAVMLLRANVLLRPTSGVRPELVDALLAMLNADIIHGCRSREASARVATLLRSATSGSRSWGREGSSPGAPTRRRRLCSPRPASRPIASAPRKGLSFINGTQAQTALLALLVHDARCSGARPPGRRR